MYIHIQCLRPPTATALTPGIPRPCRDILGHLVAIVGPSRGHLGAILGPSWGFLGPSWGNLEALLGCDGHGRVTRCVHARLSRYVADNDVLQGGRLLLIARATVLSPVDDQSSSAQRNCPTHLTTQASLKRLTELNGT